MMGVVCNSFNYVLKNFTKIISNGSKNIPKFSLKLKPILLNFEIPIFGI